jgi:hypothetical protein
MGLSGVTPFTGVLHWVDYGRSNDLVLEERVSRLEGAYEQVGRRLDDLNQNVASLRAEMRTEIGGLRADMNGLRAEVNGRLNNLYVLIGGLWATMVAGFVALFVAG